MLPAFTFRVRPVVPVMDAVRAELEAIALRNGLNAIHASGMFWGVEARQISFTEFSAAFMA